MALYPLDGRLVDVAVYPLDGTLVDVALYPPAGMLVDVDFWLEVDKEVDEEVDEVEFDDDEQVAFGRLSNNDSSPGVPSPPSMNVNVTADSLMNLILLKP